MKTFVYVDLMLEITKSLATKLFLKKNMNGRKLRRLHCNHLKIRRQMLDRNT